MWRQKPKLFYFLLYMLRKQKAQKGPGTKYTCCIAWAIKAARSPAISVQLKFNDLCQQSDNRKF